jgi:hypothetical protein
MKPIAYTAHAEENLVARSIRREDVEQAVWEADQLEESPPFPQGCIQAVHGSSSWTGDVVEGYH